MSDCKTCKNLSTMLGKKLFMPALRPSNRKITFFEIEQHLAGLDLEVVGGLTTRGWTVNDVDVVGNKRDVPTLAARLHEASIPHPIHWCGSRTNHSHLSCVFYGAKLVLTGKGF